MMQAVIVEEYVDKVYAYAVKRTYSEEEAEELAKLCGVPAYYVEERIDNLLKREAIISPVKGKYQTNFIIWTDKHGIYCEENAETALIPIMDKMMEALRGIAKEAAKIDFYKAEKSEEDLFYLYGAMAFDYARAKFHSKPFPKIKEKADGFCWNYVGSMETGAHRRIGFSVLHCGNNGGKYTHTVYANYGGFARRDMMYDIYIDACEDILRNGEAENQNAAALAIRDGYIVRREDGSLFVTAPAFTKLQKKQFDEIAHKYFAPIIEEYTACVNHFLTGYKKLFPKHLQMDADYMCSHEFIGMYQVIIAMAQKNGEIPLPTSGSYCDVMVQYRE